MTIVTVRSGHGHATPRGLSGLEPFDEWCVGFGADSAEDIAHAFVTVGYASSTEIQEPLAYDTGEVVVIIRLREAAHTLVYRALTYCPILVALEEAESLSRELSHAYTIVGSEGASGAILVREYRSGEATLEKEWLDDQDPFTHADAYVAGEQAHFPPLIFKSSKKQGLVVELHDFDRSNLESGYICLQR